MKSAPIPRRTSTSSMPKKRKSAITYTAEDLELLDQLQTGLELCRLVPSENICTWSTENYDSMLLYLLHSTLSIVLMLYEDVPVSDICVNERDHGFVAIQAQSWCSKHRIKWFYGDRDAIEGSLY